MKFLATIFLIGLLVTAASFQTIKPKPTTTKPGSKTTPATAKPKPAATPAKRASEKDEWEKATAVTDPTARIAALKKFVAAFPKSTHASEAYSLISTDEATLGNQKLAAGEMEAAMKFIRASVNDAPKPVPDQLFADTLSRFAMNLYFRGLRDEGFEIAKTLEKAAENAGQLLNIANFYLSIENGSEAKRVAENVIKLDPNSSAAYQTLGLANRVDFKLDESAAAYAKALELEPESLTARRGLAEMRRSLGKADEAVALYREILAKDEANIPARTGLILALFDADKSADAETEMAKSLESNPGNVILLAGAAYWYAAHNSGAQAVAMAQKALDADPRFIWSHIALARGLLLQNKPADAERVLLAARKYGNFPTLEYEIASARLAAGLYREAAEGLSQSFSIKDGSIHTNLGGRLPSDAKNFTDLIAGERKASLFTPTAADNVENAAQLRSLLEFEQELRSPEPKSEIAMNAADEFVRGDDKMKVHRQIFAASELLDKKIALAKVIEITKSAPSALDAGLEVSDPSTAVMASELYENRAIALARGEFIYVPAVPRAMLSAVLRGRIEEISGWASFQMDDTANAVVHLKRAVGVLPVDSAWWRSSTWRLGNALAANGNDAEALEAYTKSYKSTAPNALRYTTIESLYKRVKGNTLGLEERIGPNPAAPGPSEAVAKNVEPTPESKPDIPVGVPIISSEATLHPGDAPAAQSSAASTPSPTVASTEAPLKVAEPEQPRITETPAELPTVSPTASTETATPSASPSPTPEPTKESAVSETSPTATLAATPDPQSTETQQVAVSDDKKPAMTPKELFPPVIITIPARDPSRTAVKTQPTAEPTPTNVATDPTSEAKPSASPTPESNLKESKPTDVSAAEKRTAAPSPPSETPSASAEQTSQPTPEIKPCTLIVAPENISLKSRQGVLAVIVRREKDEQLDELKGVSSSPLDVDVRREMIEGLSTQALFVLSAVSANTGVYHVTFEMPCGKKEVSVKVE